MRRVITVAAISIGLVLGTQAPSLAQTGDRTLGGDRQKTIELASNQCRAMSSVTVDHNGGPQPVPTDTVVYVTTNYAPCKARARIKYVKRVNGPTYFTPYTYATGKGDTRTTGFRGGFRCYTETGVRRKDGTYYTRSIMNPGRPSGCGH